MCRASLSGTVIKAEKDELLGYVVEMNHDNGVVTHYHSLENLAVEEGDAVKQGEILGRAGRNLYNTEAGVHVHFEIRQNGIPVNPTNLFEQPIDSIGDALNEEEKTPADDQGDPVETPDEKTPEKPDESEAADDTENEAETVNELG